MLQELRTSAGFSNRGALAEKIGYSTSLVAKAETGQRMPGIDFLAAFCTETGADFNELLRLRLEAGGNSPEALGMEVRDDPASYNGLRQHTESRRGAHPDATAAAAEIRREVQQAGLPLDWALLIVQLVAGGDLQPGGARAIIEFLDQMEGAP